MTEWKYVPIPLGLHDQIVQALRSGESPAISVAEFVRRACERELERIYERRREV